MKTLDLAKVKKELLVECEEDHVGLWSIIRHLRITFGENLDADRVRAAVMEIVADLLRSGTVKAGFPAPDGRGFEPWDLSPGAVIARIEAEWDALGREPTIGDIVWFTTVP